MPEEYFLDGDYDYLDLTDEKQLFDDTKCAFQQVNYECDDRLYLPDYFLSMLRNSFLYGRTSESM